MPHHFHNNYVIPIETEEIMVSSRRAGDLQQFIIRCQLYLLSLVLICVQCTSAANILAILPMASPSHHIWNSPLLITLANKGHNVTVVSPISQKTKIPNLTDLEIEGLMDVAYDDSNYEDLIGLSPELSTAGLLWFMADLCEKTMKSKAWKQIMNYPKDTKFDLMIIDSIGAECLVGSIDKFGIPPIVVTNGFNVPQWMLEMVGTPNILSHMPHTGSSVTDHMSFMERLMNVYYTAHTYYAYHYQYLPEINRVAKEHFGPQVPPFQDVVKKVCLGMANFHPVLDYAWGMTPNLIPIAGIQLRDPKALPQDIKKFLDDAKDGAIYFSLGSNIKSEKLSTQKKREILEALAMLPQKVLWKFETDNLPGQPKNVKIGKWLPQTDILAHPNIKLFITHSGLLSTHEAIYRGVPVLGIPFFADQPVNIQKLVNFGAGLQLDFKELTKETFVTAIQTILRNSSYRENMKILSNKFRDAPETPLERAVFWTEYVLKHKGAPNLRSAALDLNIVQYLLLDVIALLMAIPVLLLLLLYCLCCRRKYLDPKKVKRN